MDQRHVCKALDLALPLLIAASIHAADSTNLRCEYVDNPLGVDAPRPRLSWTMENRAEAGATAEAGRGIRQTAYQAVVTVTSAVRLLEKDRGDVCDGGKAASDRSVAIPYGGPAAKAPGVQFLRMENNAAVYEVGSGTYRFESTLRERSK